jgi:hypothetical protein
MQNLKQCIFILKPKKNKQNLMTQDFLVKPNNFRVQIRASTPSSLICERLNLSAKTEIINYHDTKNVMIQIERILILPVILHSSESWSLT